MKRSKISRTGSILSALWNVWRHDGNPDESVSARSYREGKLMGDPAWQRRLWRINRMFRDPDHCRRSHEIDVEHARALLAAGGARVANQPEGVLD